MIGVKSDPPRSYVLVSGSFIHSLNKHIYIYRERERERETEYLLYIRPM